MLIWLILKTEEWNPEMRALFKHHNILNWSIVVVLYLNDWSVVCWSLLCWFLLLFLITFLWLDIPFLINPLVCMRDWLLSPLSGGLDGLYFLTILYRWMWPTEQTATVFNDFQFQFQIKSCFDWIRRTSTSPIIDVFYYIQLRIFSNL